jgi:acyl-coenzyme A thioesterase PaaI-like protein
VSQANQDWAESPNEGWTALPLPLSIRNSNFVSGDSGGERLTVLYYRREQGESLLAKVLFGPKTQGPPGHAHGGSMAAVLDEVMGASAWLAGHMVVAAEITIQFKSMLPLGTRCLAEGRVQSVSGRRVLVTGVLHDLEGNMFAEGRGTFVKLADDQIRHLADQGDNFVAQAQEHGDPAKMMASGGRETP